MKEKGLVMEVNGRNVILLTKDGQFISRPNTGLCPQIGEEIIFEGEKQKVKWFSLSFFAVAAVLMFALFAGKLWYESYIPFIGNGVVTYVTVDINPSVELGLDQEKTVITVMPLNKDARRLLEGLTLKGRTSEEAVEVLVDAAAQEGYFGPEKQNQIIINVSRKVPDNTDSRQISNSISQAAEKTLAKQNFPVKIDVITTDFALREKAGELGISAGRYAILVEAKEAGLDIDADKIKRSGLTKAIKDAGGEPGKIIKKAQEENDFPEKIQKWQKELKNKGKVIKEEEKDKTKSSQADDKNSNIKFQGNDKKEADGPKVEIINRNDVKDKVKDKDKDKDKEKDKGKDKDNKNESKKGKDKLEKNNQEITRGNTQEKGKEKDTNKGD